eukprot:gnl/Spiro4/5524_TR2802_c0_g1_i1.p1 gnl/Spiro4/5524_TR2802_c0_g1~~gnl/Spiro4/5524_TR2802_c0_g1_i1.p1  ORF type:complete len:656 (+),score=197.58 gnl/Spiro4/5524_TR2802_c0_g1_i1:59-2026(+)
MLSRVAAGFSPLPRVFTRILPAALASLHTITYGTNAPVKMDKSPTPDVNFGILVEQQLNQLCRHSKAKNYILNCVETFKPDDVHFCSGTEEEYQALTQTLIDAGTAQRVNPEHYPNSIYTTSDASDVARVENRTFICSENEEDAGPTNIWKHPTEMKKELAPLFDGCMRGRTMYVMPFSMGPVGSKFSKVGVEISDSAYVALNMKIMTRMGDAVWKLLNQRGDSEEIVKATHTVGAPLKPGEKGAKWPCNKNKYITHFPQTREIISYGSGYGGNALLGKKCFALRIASVQARDEGWLAEHMLILGITNPAGKKKYMAAAFPSACGKTNMAMLNPTLPGWKVETVGDDIAWLRLDGAGHLRAVNPEAGMFGVAPGTNRQTNLNAMQTIRKNTIFTNVARTPDGGVWWEGLEGEPKECTDWTGQLWTPGCGRKAAHPNARFTTPMSQCPVVSPEFENPDGVPISAIVFGGRRESTMPLVFQALNWEHGTTVGATVCSETTAANIGAVGELRHDPFAMLPFCGYNMGDYFNHWLSFSKRSTNLPAIFHVNWFRKDANGKFIWPGFGDNSRVLKWIFDRTDNADTATASPIGHIPKKGSLDLTGLKISEEQLNKLFEIDRAAWKHDIQAHRDYFKNWKRLPSEILNQLKALEDRLDSKL